MPKYYKWLYSCETYGFDTPDGLLHQGEYALSNDELGGFLVYNPDNPFSFLRVGALGTTLMEVHRLGSVAFDVYQDPDTGNKIRFRCDVQTYRNLGKDNSGPRPNKLKE